MNSEKLPREHLLAHCGQLHDDDGVDPRDFPDFQGDKQDYKALQLCAQVFQTLDLVLSGDFEDERLLNLRVIRVDPAPNSGQLLVTVQADGPTDPTTIAEILDRLRAVSGHLRTEIAAAIHRKRTPRLLFQVVPRSLGNEQ